MSADQRLLGCFIDVDQLLLGCFKGADHLLLGCYAIALVLRAITYGLFVGLTHAQWACLSLRAPRKTSTHTFIIYIDHWLKTIGPLVCQMLGVTIPVAFLVLRT